MAAKGMLFHDQARSKLCAGLNTLANAVRVTLGPKGRTVVLENPYGPPTVINSGVIVAREIELADRFENLGAQMVREVASKTSEMAGDGTTTATVLAQALVQQGMKYVAAGFDPMDLKRGIDTAVEKVIQNLKANSRTLSTSQEIAQIGTISANGDAAIGDMIAEAMRKVGNDGVIMAEEGRGMQNVLETVEGLQIDRGSISPYFIAESEKGRAVLEDAWVLLSQKEISAIADLLPVLELVMKTGRPLLLIAEDLSGDALATLVLNSLRGTLKVCAVKAPSFGDQRKAVLEDIAVVTGAQVAGSDAGAKLENVKLSDLGRAARIEVDRDSTTIIGGAGDAERIHNRISQIRARLETADDNVERRQLEERAGKLSGGVALIRIGASTETEMKERKSRVEDALHATRAAVQEGIGAGGGVALLRAREALKEVRLPNLAQESGVRIVERALEEPVRQIVANAGGDPDVVVEAIVAGSGDYGYNAAAMSYGSMTEMGIIDPTKVTRLALTNAASIASLVLTTDCIVVEQPGRGVPGPGPEELGY